MGTMRLADIFGRFFRIVQADTPELLRISYRLRYDVYCIEHPFLDPSHYQDDLETDEYDGHSLHALLQHVPSGSFMGTVRLIMPKLGTNHFVMPFSELCADPRFHTGRILPVASTAEVSRFAISKAFRRRATDGTYPDEHEPSDLIIDDRRVLPSLSLGLIIAITHMGLANGVTHVCAVMDPALFRLLQRLGIDFSPLGPPVEYHGSRQPCYAEALPLLEQLRIARPDYWDLVTNGGKALPAPPRAATSVFATAV
jgi:N-acyl amino acid synthase of PEP-CTERM/exosortase system